MKLESELQYKILCDLRSRPDVRCFKIMKASDRGIPDVFFTSQKTGAVFVECKREDGVKSPQQERWVSGLNERGVRAVFIFSWDEWVEFKKVIGL